MFDDCTIIVFKAKYEAKHRKWHPSKLATQLKIVIPKQMLQRLPIALAQAKAGNTSGNLSLNEIRQIIYFLYQAKEITKKYTMI